MSRELPTIAGLTFRHYQGEQDLPALFRVSQSALQADHEDAAETLEDLTNAFRHPANFDPSRDVLIAEVNGQMAAYGQVTGKNFEETHELVYDLTWYVIPEWRGMGLEQAFLCREQERVRQVIRDKAFRGTCLFEAHATSDQPERMRLLEENGFQAVRWGSKMTCFNLEEIPDLHMPPGLEVRPVKTEHYRPIWDAMLDAFHGHWGYAPPTEEDYTLWLESSHFRPDLWQVAWDGDQVAGMVLNYITTEPAAAGLGIAWTEDICVRRPWRRRGLARALLARSMRMFREMGYSQTSLGVDLNNPDGARQLYESMGYQLISVLTIYRKDVAG